MLGLWNNFHERAAKEGLQRPAHPLYFLKAGTCFAAHGEPIRRPAGYSGMVVFEAELGIVIGRRVAAIDPAAAPAAIFGYTCVNDVTARDIQREEKHFTRAKSFDTFCPVGPWVDTSLDPADLAVSCRVNGTERQRGSTRDMVFDPAALLAFISNVMTLLPGDLISTGTPEGVGRLQPGDWVEVEVGGLGILRNPVT
jgi:2-keto-4-pentenoate hydratase/2-oxohepta-3-ene-1,7-dioic acid hydratase in catechol pathway